MTESSRSQGGRGERELQGKVRQEGGAVVVVTSAPFKFRFKFRSRWHQLSAALHVLHFQFKSPRAIKQIASCTRARGSGD